MSPRLSERSDRRHGWVESGAVILCQVVNPWGLENIWADIDLTDFELAPAASPASDNKGFACGGLNAWTRTNRSGSCFLAGIGGIKVHCVRNIALGVDRKQMTLPCRSAHAAQNKPNFRKTFIKQNNRKRQTSTAPTNELAYSPALSQ